MNLNYIKCSNLELHNVSVINYTNNIELCKAVEKGIIITIEKRYQDTVDTYYINSRYIEYWR